MANPEHSSKKTLEQEVTEQEAAILAACGGQLPMEDELKWVATNYALKRTATHPEEAIKTVLAAGYGASDKPEERAYFLAQGFVTDGRITLDPAQPHTLVFTYAEWNAFIKGVEAGEFDFFGDLTATDEKPQSGKPPARRLHAHVDDTGRLVFGEISRLQDDATLHVLGQTATVAQLLEQPEAEQ